MPKRRGSRRDVIHKKTHFVGRGSQLVDFSENFDRLDAVYKQIWMVHGQGGIGKSTLLRRFRALCTKKGYLTTVVDEFTRTSVLEVMSAIADQLAKQGHSLPEFEQRYATYQKLRHLIDADPERPSATPQFGRVISRVGSALANEAPFGGVAVALVGEERIQEYSDQFASFVTRKLGKDKQNEASLVLDPIRTLTPLFIEEISCLSEARAIGLFFDTYEQLSGYLDGWLLKIFGGTYGDFPLDILVVMAGRYAARPRVVSRRDRTLPPDDIAGASFRGGGPPTPLPVRGC